MTAEAETCLAESPLGTGTPSITLRGGSLVAESEGSRTVRGPCRHFLPGLLVARFQGDGYFDIPIFPDFPLVDVICHGGVRPELYRRIVITPDLNAYSSCSGTGGERQYVGCVGWIHGVREGDEHFRSRPCLATRAQQLQFEGAERGLSLENHLAHIELTEVDRNRRGLQFASGYPWPDRYRPVHHYSPGNQVLIERHRIPKFSGNLPSGSNVPGLDQLNREVRSRIQVIGQAGWLIMVLRPPCVRIDTAPDTKTDSRHRRWIGIVLSRPRSGGSHVNHNANRSGTGYLPARPRRGAGGREDNRPLGNIGVELRRSELRQGHDKRGNSDAVGSYHLVVVY
ncbi:hypothetical protein IHMA87_02546 [Pseudomonas paraeruginosa]|nr:hypothetical protein IHMA87_02546 [Pseudomonas aeruginosa]